MDPARHVDVVSLRRGIDETRVSISSTVGALRRRTDEAMQWQSYITGHPASALAGAALLGLMVGRRLAGSRSAPRHPSGSDWETEAGLSAPARLAPASAGSPSAAAASWQRLATRVEGLVNHVIDEVADAAEDAVVPAIAGRVRALLNGRSATWVDRRIPTTPTGEGGLA
jgi:hypothetical protein